MTGMAPAMEDRLVNALRPIMERHRVKLVNSLDEMEPCPQNERRFQFISETDPRTRMKYQFIFDFGDLSEQQHWAFIDEATDALHAITSAKGGSTGLLRFETADELHRLSSVSPFQRVVKPGQDS